MITIKLQNQCQTIINNFVGNNSNFDQKVALLRITIPDDMLKEHMDIIIWKMEKNDFMINSIEQICNLFSSSCQNKNTQKGDIVTDIKDFKQTKLMRINDTPDVRK